MNETEKEQVGSQSLLKAARRILLASIGAVALAQDEIEDFVNKLVERGEIAEKDGSKLVKEILEKRQERLSKLESEVSKHFEAALTHMNIPTKKDLVAMTERLAALEKAIELHGKTD